MTIVFFCRRFYPQIGGVEKHVQEIGKRLVKKGHKIIVITELEKNTNDKNQQSNTNSAKRTGKVDGIDIYRINPGKDNWFKKFRIWKELWGLKKLIFSADVVHCHDVFFWYLPFRFLRPTKKVYTTFHGYEGNYIPTKKAILMHKISEKLSYGNICIGGFFEKWYGTKATYVSYGATEIPNTKEQNVSDKNLIVFLGRLEEETGIMEYLKAFNKLTKEYKQLKLNVLGDGSLMDVAVDYVKENRLPVKFKGFIQKTTFDLERSSFVFVSRYLGILESMASKKYVLSVYNNKIKEDYLKMTPFAKYIAISKNADEIYSDMKAILTDQSKVNIKVENAYDWVKDKTWDNLVKMYLKLWSLEA